MCAYCTTKTTNQVENNQFSTLHLCSSPLMLLMIIVLYLQRRMIIKSFDY